jgi:hypothetical protein
MTVYVSWPEPTDPSTDNRKKGAHDFRPRRPVSSNKADNTGRPSPEQSIAQGRALYRLGHNGIVARLSTGTMGCGVIRATNTHGLQSGHLR